MLLQNNTSKRPKSTDRRSPRYLEGDWHFGCLPHVNQSFFCCGDELLELREHAEKVLVYRKRALNEAADQMDSFRMRSLGSQKWKYQGFQKVGGA